MAQIVGSKVASKSGAGDGLYAAFLANLDGDLKLDCTGKTIPKHKAGWKARDAEKDAAKVTFGKLKENEKQEVREFLQPAIDEFLGKKKAFRDFQSQESTMGRRGGRGWR